MNERERIEREAREVTSQVIRLSGPPFETCVSMVTALILRERAAAFESAANVADRERSRAACALASDPFSDRISHVDDTYAGRYDAAEEIATDIRALAVQDRAQ